MSDPVRSILILGGGSAGLLAALALRTRLPHVPVTLVRSAKLGVIGVGEGTNVSVPHFLHGYLGLDQAAFMRRVDPLYKRGVRFIWGSRPHYNFGFGINVAHEAPGLPRPAGYYCDGDMGRTSVISSLMESGRFFARGPQGAPRNIGMFGYHFENEKLVAFLESEAAARGVAIVDDELRQAAVGECGVEELRMASGRTFKADLYVDASGFQSELLGKALGEPFESFKSSLFCERAVVGKWARTAEAVNPHTTAENMQAGWCWQIEHRHAIARGYVYAPAFISDAEAEAEFRRKNPRITDTRVVKFTSGRYRRLWVRNVVAVGNASGFVEPLEATALGAICEQSNLLVQCLLDSGQAPGPSMVAGFNRATTASWDAIRWFLALHYKFNTRFDTPFWREARASANLGDAEEVVAFYKENGPSHMGRALVPRPVEMFGLDGYWLHLLGMQVPHAGLRPLPLEEQIQWAKFQAGIRQMADNGMDFREMHGP